MNILTLNAGSNSLKFEVVAVEPENRSEPSPFGKSLVTGTYDDIGKEHSSFALLENKQPHDQEEIEIRDHCHATELLFEWIESGKAKNQGIHGLADLERIGHRVVHGAHRFQGPVQISDEVIRQIEELEDLAPLHNQSALKVIRAAQARAKCIPMFAVFDTVFHQTIPDQAALYPLPVELSQRHKLRRYGFHGISHRYMMLRYAQISGRAADQLNIITLHLEGGSSAAAIQHGKSIDTSMGFTPLEGLMMGTRCGDIDPAIIPYLMRKEHWNADSIEKFLNKKCGLLGVSGLSADTRVLREHLADPHVNLALDMFAYRVRKYIGAYLAALGGTDAIVVGGGIGENTPLIRERIFEHFDWCGAALDRARNNAAIDLEASITTIESTLPIWVVPTQEGLMLAAEIANCN
jgi:acetate kinase